MNADLLCQVSMRLPDILKVLACPRVQPAVPAFAEQAVPGHWAPQVGAGYNIPQNILLVYGPRQGLGAAGGLKEARLLSIPQDLHRFSRLLMNIQA